MKELVLGTKAVARTARSVLASVVEGPPARDPPRPLTQRLQITKTAGLLRSCSELEFTGLLGRYARCAGNTRPTARPR